MIRVPFYPFVLVLLVLVLDPFLCPEKKIEEEDEYDDESVRFRTSDFGFRVSFVIPSFVISH